MKITPLKLISSLLSVLNIGLWGALFFAGLDGLSGIRDQHVAGYPTQTQTLYYAVLPAVMALTGIAYSVLMWRRAEKNIGIGLPLLMILAIPAYLFFYGGGV